MDGASSSSESRTSQLRAARLTNGDSQRLVREITQTSKKREAVNLSHLEPKKSSLKQPKRSFKRRKSLADERQARDPRDEARTPSISRPESPFTQYPAVDFDGLSWPSKNID
jgi:hypothetical protein